MKNLTLLSATVLIATSGLVFGIMKTACAADLTWDWSYSGTGITASGTFLTDDTPDTSGFYQIIGITGTRNGETITGLQPMGTAIPGNDGYPVDDLISLNPGQQLTDNGFGYSTSGGNYANPFFADYFTPQVYLEVFSSPPFISPSELSVSFSANVVVVPEPNSTFGLLAFGTLILVSRPKRKKGRLFWTGYSK